MEKLNYDSTNYRTHKLSSSDHIRYLNYSGTVQQEIATAGATVYLLTDAGGNCTYQAPNLQMITEACHAADERYFQYTNLQMQLLNAQQAFDLAPSFATHQQRDAIVNQLGVLRYNPAIEDPRQKFFEQKLAKSRKESTEVTVAVTHVFRYLFATLDSFLCNKLQMFASRTDAMHPPHVNLAEALQFLQQEMKGNPVANREACLSQIDKLRVATSLEELRFVLDVFVSVTTTVATSIRLYGGNGMLSNSQVHYKLLSKLDPNSPALTFVRMQLTNQPPDTTTLIQLRDLIKPELDRVVDPLRSLGRSNVLSNSRNSSYLSFVDPNSSSISNLSSSVEDYNSCQPITFDPQAMVSQAVDEALQAAARSHAPLSRPRPDGASGSQLRNSSFSTTSSASASSDSRPKNVCTNFLKGICDKSADECRFLHPAHLEGSLAPGAEGRVPRPSTNAKTGRPFPRPPSPKKGPYKSTPKGAFRKPAGSPVASRKIQFKAHVAAYEEEDQFEEEGDYEGDEEA